MGRRLAGRSRVRSIPCANGGIAGVEVSSTLNYYARAAGSWLGGRNRLKSKKSAVNSLSSHRHRVCIEDDGSLLALRGDDMSPVTISADAGSEKNLWGRWSRTSGHPEDLQGNVLRVHPGAQ